MKNKLILTLILAFFALVGYSYIQQQRITKLRQETDRYKQNTTILMQDISRYRTSDSLNAVKVGVLSLKLDELEELRAGDMKTIEKLKVDKRGLEQLITIQMQSIANLKGKVKDSIVYVNNIIQDTLQALNVSDEWIDLHGEIYDDGSFSGILEVRDSLTVVESVQYRRFLGFLWRTKRIKSREVDVVNKNPYTTIMGVESIIIEQ